MRRLRERAGAPLLIKAPKTDLRVLWEGVSHLFVTLERFGQDDEGEELGDTFEMFFRDHGEVAFDRLQLLLEMDEAWRLGILVKKTRKRRSLRKKRKQRVTRSLRRTRRTARKMMMCWRMILLQSTTSKIK